MYDGLLINRRQGSNRDIQLELVGNNLELDKVYRVQLYAKLRNDFKSDQTITVIDQSMQIVAEAKVIQRNQCVKVESVLELTGLNTAGMLTIRTPDYSGDLIIDHVLDTESFHFDDCIRKINFTL